MSTSSNLARNDLLFRSKLVVREVALGSDFSLSDLEVNLLNQLDLRQGLIRGFRSGATKSPRSALAATQADLEGSLRGHLD